MTATERVSSTGNIFRNIEVGWESMTLDKALVWLLIKLREDPHPWIEIEHKVDLESKSQKFEHSLDLIRWALYAYIESSSWIEELNMIGQKISYIMKHFSQVNTLSIWWDSLKYLAELNAKVFTRIWVLNQETIWVTISISDEAMKVVN